MRVVLLYMVCIIRSVICEAIQVWVLYCQFAVDKMEVFEDGIEFVRNVFECAVTACGQHVTKVMKNVRNYPTLLLLLINREALFGMHIVNLKLQYCHHCR